MIPALLSCFFVAYLYHTLNSDDLVEACSAGESNQTTEDRLKELSRRIEKLADQVDRGGER